jgi:hypothetical protein
VDVVREPIGKWLTCHSDTANARFIYSEWLEAGGELDLVREPIRRWISNHANTIDAKHLRRRWIRAGGEPGVVDESGRALAYA